MKGKKNKSSLKQIKKMSLTRGTVYIGYLHKRFGGGGTVRPSKREMEVGLYDITAGI